MATALRRLVTAGKASAEPHRYDAVPTSPADVTCAAHPELSERPADLRDAYRHGAMLLAQAEDHALGLADLIRGRHTFACHPVARALAETSARSFNLFAPELAPAERLRRMWNEVLWALHEAIPLQAIPDPERGAAAERRLTEYMDSLRRHTEDEVKKPGRGAPFVGRRAEGLGAMLDTLLADGVPGPFPYSFGRLFQATVSAVTHGATHGFMLLAEVSADPTGQAIARKAPQTPADLADSLVMAPMAFAFAYAAAARQMGWEVQPILVETERLMGVWGAAFRDYS